MGYSWEDVAMVVFNEYGFDVDHEEEFFICPECGEPIYKCDWEGTENLCEGYCPVCEFKIMD